MPLINRKKTDPIGIEASLRLSDEFAEDITEFLIENKKAEELAELTPEKCFRYYLEWNGIQRHHIDFIRLLEELGWAFVGR